MPIAITISVTVKPFSFRFITDFQFDLEKCFCIVDRYMNDRKNYYFFAGLVIVVIVIFVSRNKPSQIENPQGKDKAFYSHTETKPAKDFSSETANAQSAKAAHIANIQQKVAQNEQAKKDVLNKSNSEKKNFGEIAFLEYSINPKYIFLPKEVDEGMAAIIGRSGKPKEFIAIIARKGETSDKDIKDFLPEMNSQLPEISPELLRSQIAKAPMPTEKGSGLKEGMWMVLSSKELQLYIFRANRADGKGSYMIVSQGNTIADPSLIQDLQDTIKSLKARPAK